MASDAESRVRLSGRTLVLSRLRENAGEYANLFSRAKAEIGHAECLCRTPTLRLVIRCSRAGRYHLAGWPGEGELHDPPCPFHKLAPGLSGREAYSAEAIREGDNGVSIRLDAVLARSLTEPPTAQTSGEPREGRSRRTVGLLGLLHWLWDESQLTAWHPRWRRRNWWICHARLRQQTEDCSINQDPADTALYVVPPFRPDTAEQNTAAFEAFKARLGRHGSKEHRGLILGEIKTVTPTQYGARYALAHQRAPLFISAALDQRVRRSYRPVFAEAGAGHDARRVGLFLVELSAKGNLTIVDMAAMLLNSLYIPADSSHEVAMGNALAHHGRAFVKPVRYDGTEAVFPDFVLTDVTPHAYVEVYGIHGREDYDQRKRIKQAHYQRQGAELIEWDVVEPIPDLSLHRGRRTSRTEPDTVR
ncbi:DUF1173 family protein [Streptomyces chartreusis]|uniref:DUF1173 family protein n=1 Tax=Streptomyces chartreusis TaxID=1969 RepID=A0A7H8TA96_STRCX|nr:DUF1173 family protein [Streptomyces chartreusis]QKZ20324.1 DUF1173 family protein [Streptomyces chartreusis]